MPTPSIASKSVTSPDMSLLAYSILYDISVGVPVITITNHSTVSTPANLTWWFVLTTPSGAPIHMGSLGSPDELHTAWTTFSPPPNAWPTPGGKAPYSQVEFSPGAPYICTVYVQDSALTTFSLQVNTIIKRPNGNTNDSRGNFGEAVVEVLTDCDAGLIKAADKTNYTYQNLLGTYTTNSWTLVYPADANDNLPTPATGSNTPNINFLVGFSGTGYNLLLKTYANYDFGNGSAVTIQYRFNKAFAVWCSISLCKVNCGIKNLTAAVTKSCGDVSNTKLEAKLQKITQLMANTITPGIMEPLCGIDVPGAIQEVLALLDGYAVNCGCTDEGVNYTRNSPTPSLDVVSVSVPIYIASPAQPRTPTRPPELNFPGRSYFPRQLYDDSGQFLIGVFTNMAELVMQLNNFTGWMQYGTFFDEGLSEVGCFPTSAGVTIPPIYISDGTGNGQFGNNTFFESGSVTYLVPLRSIQHYNPSDPKILVPQDSFPSNWWVDMDGTVTYLGSMASAATLITTLNTLEDPRASFYTATTAFDTINIAVVVSESNFAGGDNIQLYTDALDNDYLLFGANHKNMTPTPPNVGAETAFALAIGGPLGDLPGIDISKTLWHTIKLNNRYVLSTQTDTGVQYIWDVSDPLNPVIARVTTLPQVAGAPNLNFSGLPNVGSLPSYYSLYYPTDYNTFDVNSLVYQWEAVTGSVWGAALHGGTPASFHLTALIGKCPRVHINNTLYFTQDGSLEGDTGQASLVIPGNIVICTNMTNPLTGGNYSSTTTIMAAEDVYAAAYDGYGTIYFIGAAGSISTYDVASATVTHHYLNILPITSIGSGARMNAKYYNGNLYVSVMNITMPFPYNNTGTVIINANSLATTPVLTPFESFVTSGGNNKNHFNVLPIGNILYLTYSDDDGSKKGLVAIFSLSGNFLGLMPSTVTGGGIYNLVAVPTKPDLTPNNLV